MQSLIPAHSRTLIKRRLPIWAWRYLRKQAGDTSPLLVDQIGRYLPEAPVILEAGANDGSSTVSLWKQWPKAQIHAFEPTPDAYEKLAMAVDGLPNVHCANVALGARQEYLKMSVSSNASLSSSLLRPARVTEFHHSVDFVGEVEVPVVNPQQWLSERGVSQVDLVWFDMQGYEPLVVAACPELFKSVRVLKTEVNLVEVYEGAILYPEFRTLLESIGFSIIEESFGKAQGDIICVRKDLLD